MTNAPTNPAPRSFGSPVADAVAALVSPIVSDLELEIYELEFSGGVVRVEVDTPTGQESGVSLDKIALITRLLGRELDHNDPVPGRYTLEVSSPGLERNLRRAEHYQREVGKTVSLRLHTAIDGARRFQGILAAATPQEITLHILPEGKRAEARSITIDIANIDRAKTVFVWAAAPKPGSPEARKQAELEAQFAALEANSDDDFDDDSDDEFEDDFETKHSDTTNTEATAS